MNGASMDPPRLQDHHDQPNLAERIAGQAARELAEPDTLSQIAMARIAARLQDRVRRRRPLRLGWAFAVAAFLLGIVTAASAARLDLVPRWLTRIVHGEPEPALRSAPARNRPRARTSSPGPSATAPAADFAPAEAPPDPTPAEASPSASTPAAAEVPAGALAPAASEGIFVPSSPPATVSPVARDPSANDRRRASSGRKVTALAMLAEPPPTEAKRPAGQGAVAAVEPAVAAPSPMAVTSADGLQLPFSAPPPAPLSSGASQPSPSAAPAVRPVAPAGSAAVLPAPSRRPAAHLKQVVRALRVQRAPADALALLDRYAGELTGNAFADEALLLRVEAMLALDQRAQVLRLLDGISLADVAAARALLVTRGQLRAAVNRCAEGIGDFDAVLAEAGRPPKQALLGRARCRQKLGDDAGARADLDRYRRELPGESLP